MPEKKKFPYPVIIDTDIGDDIDDTWTLMYILASGAFDVRAVLLTNFDTEYKAKLVAKMLQEVGRTDIPVFVSESVNIPDNYRRGQELWIGGFSLSGYGGMLVREGWAEKLYELICGIGGKVCIFELAPNTSLSRLYQAHSDIAGRCFVYAMAGAVEKSYETLDGVVGEFNICADKAAAEKILASGIEYTMLPLDVCATIRLKGEEYARFLKKESVYAEIVKQNYKVWLENGYFENTNDYQTASSILFDMIVPWYALYPDHFEMCKNKITLENGITKVSEGSEHTWARNLKDADVLLRDLADTL